MITLSFKERERESINYCPLFVEINFLDLKYMFRERERKRVSIYGIKYMLREERELLSVVLNICREKGGVGVGVGEGGSKM